MKSICAKHEQAFESECPWCETNRIEEAAPPAHADLQMQQSGQWGVRPLSCPHATYTLPPTFTASLTSFCADCGMSGMAIMQQRGANATAANPAQWIWNTPWIAKP